MLQIKNLGVTVEGKQVLRGIDLEIRPGEVTALMGPNGSGKSTLALTLMGHPSYEIKDQRSRSKDKASIKIDGKEISKLTPDERAKLGLFLANQQPVTVVGLSCQSFLWQIYRNRLKNKDQRSKIRAGEVNKKEGLVSVVEFRQWLGKQAGVLGLDKEMLGRGLNEGFSGGEKKKMEILQMLVFGPKYLILDEIDSGLDIDALKKIAETIAKVSEERKMGVLVISHYARFFKHLKPDRVAVMRQGRIVEKGRGEVIERIENRGYKNGKQ